MSKIALIADTHWGCRGNSISFLDKSKLFIDNVFFPYLNENIISTVIHLGDLVDQRKHINVNTANRLRSDLLDPLALMGCTVHWIAGNHDCFFKNTNEVNALQELILDRYPDFHIHDMNADEVIIGNLRILLVPWICQENKERILQKIKDTKAQIVFGHLELLGFSMYDNGILSTHGEDINIFNRFDIVCSGHYHHKSSKSNINYIGSMGEYTWNDYDDPKGFHVFDTETRKLTFIKNPYKMFRKVIYDDGIEYVPTDQEFRDCIVKVIVKKKSNVYFFENLISLIEAQNPINLQIIEDHGMQFNSLENEIDESESTLDICFSYIDGLASPTISLNRGKMKEIVYELYSEANIRL